MPQRLVPPVEAMAEELSLALQLLCQRGDTTPVPLLAAASLCASGATAVASNLSDCNALPAAITARAVFEAGNRAFWGSCADDGWRRLGRGGLHEQRKILKHLRSAEDIQDLATDLDGVEHALLEEEERLGGASPRAPSMFDILKENRRFEVEQGGTVPPPSNELHYAMQYALGSQYVHGSARVIVEARPAEIATEAAGLCIEGARKLLMAEERQSGQVRLPGVNARVGPSLMLLLQVQQTVMAQTA